LRADGRAILGAGGGVGGGAGFVGDDSVSVGVLTIRKKKQSAMESRARAIWGAAVLRPYTEGSDGQTVTAARSAVDGMSASR
jgi:hypothetical protein